MEDVLAENRGLKEENAALKNENAALKSEVASLKASTAWIEPVVTFVRLFKVQSAALGHSLILLLPLCGVLVALGSLELTDWSSTVPKYNARVFWWVWSVLIAGGGVVWWVGQIACLNPAFHAGFGGWRHALLTILPIQAAVMGLVLLLCLGAPVASGIDAHFYALDVVAFIAVVVFPTIIGSSAAIPLALRYFPHPFPEAKGIDRARTTALSAVSVEERYESISAGTATAKASTNPLQHGFNLFLLVSLPQCVVIGCELDLFQARIYVSLNSPIHLGPLITHARTHTDPVAIIPLYSSVLSDAWRLAFCLVGHPVLLEICLFWMRRYEGNASAYLERWNAGGKAALASCTGASAFMVEAILVINRRFLIGCVISIRVRASPSLTIMPDALAEHRLMKSPSTKIAAIVLTAIEEALSRATMVQRDEYFRRRSGKGDYTAKELDVQHVVWTMQIGNSMIIEVCAILIHALCVVLFIPHRFVFNLGYGELEETGLAVFAVVLSTMLELVGELLSDHIALRAEISHGVPADTYFEHLVGGKIVFQFGALMGATGVVLWTFSRIPTAVFCGDPNPCSCLEESSNTNFEMYRPVCACAAHVTANSSSGASCANMTLDASARFSTHPADSIDNETLMQMVFAFAGFIAVAVIIVASITIAQRKRKARRILAEKQTIINEKSHELRSNRMQLAEMKITLANAQKMVTKAMESEEAMLKPFAIAFSDLDLGATLGEGSFGTVKKGVLRGNITVAVKTLRVTKISSTVLNKFKQELKVRAAPL